MKWFWLGVIVFLTTAVTGLLMKHVPTLTEGESSFSADNTMVYRFNPDEISIDYTKTPQPAICSNSATVENVGAYACETEAGTVFDPCFILDELTLMCQPNPPLDTYQMLVTVKSLPVSKQEVSVPTAFVVQFSDGLVCNILPETQKLEEYNQTYSCNAPSSGIVGSIETTQDIWLGNFFTQSPTTGQITFGPEERLISAAWLW